MFQTTVVTYGAFEAPLGGSPLPVDRPRRSGSLHPFARTLVSFAGASGLMLLVPVVILLLGLPVVLAVRGLLELFQWAFAGLL